ncbi:unnamed protein product, partial [Rotaria sp. Silwood2]
DGDNKQVPENKAGTGLQRSQGVFSSLRYSRRQVSIQTDSLITSHQSTQTDGPIYLD